MDEDQQYYKFYQIKALIEFQEEIESMKLKVTHPLSQTGYSIVDRSWWMEEGNTMQSESPKQSRIPTNPTKFVEELCCMTEDVKVAKSYCTMEEQIALAMFASLAPDKIPEHIYTIIDSALWRIFHYINRYDLLEETTYV